MTTIEKGARAILAADKRIDPQGATRKKWETACEEARAVIVAMCEPTPEVVRKVAQVICCPNGCENTGTLNHVSFATCQAHSFSTEAIAAIAVMIDAALAEWDGK